MNTVKKIGIVCLFLGIVVILLLQQNYYNLHQNAGDFTLLQVSFVFLFFGVIFVLYPKSITGNFQSFFVNNSLKKRKSKQE
jgi:hypothetical protein